MKKVLNLLLSFILVSSVATTSLSAASNDLLNDALSKMTNVSSFTEEDGTTNIWTSSVSVRFDYDLPQKPIFSFTPPSIEAGCNGIDIKGMFIALLGLDQLGEMLQNAGTTLAWGIAVGLIYSLPGIGQAFKFINAWARKIQQLLADACNAGIKIGMWLGNKLGSNLFGSMDRVNDFFAKLDPGVYIKEHEKGSGSILLDFLGLGDLMSDDQGSPTEKQKMIVELFKGIFQSDASTLSAIITGIAEAAPNGAIKSIFGIKGLDKHSAEGPGADVPAIATHIFQLSFQGSGACSAYDNCTIVSLNDLGEVIQRTAGSSLTSAAEAQLGLFAYVLQFNFIGDLAIKSPTQQEVQELYRLVTVKEDGSGTPKDNAKSGSINKSAAEDALKRAQRTNYTLLALVGPGANLPEREGGRLLARFIWFGVTDHSDKTAFAREQTGRNRISLKAPYGMIYTVIDEDSQTGSSFIAVLPKKYNSGPLQSFYANGDDGFAGVMTESKCIVDSLVDGVSSNYTTIQTINGPVKISNDCHAKIVFPDIYKYVKIIQDSPTSKKYELKDKLVQMMAYKMGNALLNSISESMKAIHASSGDYMSTTASSRRGSGQKGNVQGSGLTAKDYSDRTLLLRKRGSNIVDFAHKELAKFYGEGYVQSVRQFESDFLQQAKENQARGLKSLQK